MKVDDNLQKKKKKKIKETKNLPKENYVKKNKEIEKTKGNFKEQNHLLA